MGVMDKLKKLFKKVKQNVVYECQKCDYEAARKKFDQDGDDLACPQCGSTRVHMDD